MKIAIDASQIIYGTGVSYYTSNLLSALSQLDQSNQYLVFASSLRKKIFLDQKLNNLKLGSNFKTRVYPLPPSYFEIFWNKFHVGNVEKFVGPVDIFHASDWTHPPAKKAKLITTIHDLAVLKYPDCFSPRVLRNQRLRLNWIKNQISAVIAVSQSTKKDIIKFLNIDPAMIKVIYEAVPKEHEKKAKKPEILKVQKKYRLKDYLLFIGGHDPRKNLRLAIAAFKQVITGYPRLKLVIVGNVELSSFGYQADDNFRINRHESRLVVIPRPDNQELIALYSGAKCLLYPSLYEGFGLPILEAMHHGCPVICSNIASLPEVAGQAAIFIDPLKAMNITQAIIRLLNSKNLQQTCIKKGYLQAKRFSWRKTAEQTIQVYRSL